MFRGAYNVATLVIAPQLVFGITELGKPYCTWLKALNMSARNVRRCPSHGIGKIFAIPKSTFFTPSRKNVLRPRIGVLTSAVVSSRKAERGREMRDVSGSLTPRPRIVGSRSTGRRSLH